MGSAIEENHKKSGNEKKPLLCARTKPDKMLLVISSMVRAPFFSLLSGFCSLPTQILKGLPLDPNYLCSNGILYS